jgi:diamine N-acetyltransferase
MNSSISKSPSTSISRPGTEALHPSPRTAIIAGMQLRPARIEDIPSIMDLERIPEYHTFVGHWPEDEHRTKMAGTDCRYLIAESESGEMAGFAILRGLAAPHRSIRLQRIVVAKPNCGVGRLMLAGILDYVFGELKAHRLWLDVFETNTRAHHVYASLGFRREGILREAVFRDGEYHTQLLMSILDREYAVPRRSPKEAAADREGESSPASPRRGTA